jgi:hypothetical protein
MLSSEPTRLLALTVSWVALAGLTEGCPGVTAGVESFGQCPDAGP